MPKIRHSKKELYRDNCQTREELEQVIAAATERQILLDDALLRIKELEEENERLRNA